MNLFVRVVDEEIRFLADGEVFYTMQLEYVNYKDIIAYTLRQDLMRIIKDFKYREGRLPLLEDLGDLASNACTRSYKQPVKRTSKNAICAKIEMAQNMLEGNVNLSIIKTAVGEKICCSKDTKLAVDDYYLKENIDTNIVDIFKDVLIVV